MIRRFGFRQEGPAFIAKNGGCWAMPSSARRKFKKYVSELVGGVPCRAEIATCLT